MSYFYGILSFFKGRLSVNNINLQQETKRKPTN